MKCKRCKRTIEDNSLFCNWCGAKQISDGKVDVPPPKRLASGEYAGRVMVNGCRERIKAATEAEYYRKARAVKLELIEVKNAPANAKLDDVLNDYITDNEPVFSPATVRGYMANKRQVKAFVDDKVRNIDWQDLINRLSEKYAPKTVRNIWGLITGACGYKNIVLPDIKLPPPVRTERSFLDQDEIKLFVKAIEGKSYELAALLALHSLRVSEIMALTKDSVKDDVIRVRGAVVENKDNKYVRKDENKTVSSTRDIPVFIPRLTDLWNALDGEPDFPHQSALTRDVKRICKRNALPVVTVHGLRHSFCSAAYYLGWDIKTTQQVGGWSSPRVPTEIYTHLSKNRYNEDIQKMKKFYS
jgi:integrase